MNTQTKEEAIMILVTGASGKTGQAVTRSILGKGEKVRVLVHRPEQISRMQSIGVHDVTAGDMRDRNAMDRALDGVRAMYHICSAVNPDESVIGKEVIAAALSAGVDHFVYHSVLHPQLEALPHHRQKLRVEEHLIESGLRYTIMQPAIYMQNVLEFWERIVQQGVYATPYGIQAHLSMVDLEDVAEVASIVLTEPGHAAATYELSSAEALSSVEIATTLGQLLGRTVRAEDMPLDLWGARVRSSGLGDYQVKTLSAMFRHYAENGFLGNPNVLTWLLRRPSTGFAAFLERTMRQQMPKDREHQ
jgi:uncharacterized protein YbjT (DUF2867 family)